MFFEKSSLKFLTLFSLLILLLFYLRDKIDSSAVQIVRSQEVLNVNIHNKHVKLVDYQESDFSSYSTPPSTTTTSLQPDYDQPSNHPSNHPSNQHSNHPSNHPSNRPNNQHSNQPIKNKVSDQKHSHSVVDNQSWDAAVKARKQSYKGELSLEMKVLIASAKGRQVNLDDRLRRAIASIDQRSGVAPSQKVLQEHISQKCREMRLVDGDGLKPRLVYYNTQHKLIYVANPKCGSTSFKKFMLKLGGDPRDYSEMEGVHNEEQNPLLKNLWDEPVEFQEEALRTYYKVTFVRNPLVRLVSGYRNKIVRVPKGHYIDHIQEIIANNYGSEKALSWLPRKPYRPSFEQFVEYLLYSGNAQENYHWAPYADHIGLCGSIKYDLIGQLETAHQHIEEMKKMIPSLEHIPFPMSRTENEVDEYSSEEMTALAFSNLTSTLISGVYRLYEKELNLLGYSLIGDEEFPFFNFGGYLFGESIIKHKGLHSLNKSVNILLT